MIYGWSRDILSIMTTFEMLISLNGNVMDCDDEMVGYFACFKFINVIWGNFGTEQD